MRYLPLLLILFTQCIFTIPATAQAKISIGNSIPLWGQVDGLTNFDLEYNRFGVHYYHQSDKKLKCYISCEDYPDIYQTSSLSFSFKPIATKYFDSGIMYFLNEFPLEGSNKFNFFVKLKTPIKRFIISYNHISNGFGINNKINPGVDVISVSVKI